MVNLYLQEMVGKCEGDEKQTWCSNGIMMQLDRVPVTGGGGGEGSEGGAWPAQHGHKTRQGNPKICRRAREKIENNNSQPPPYPRDKYKLCFIGWRESMAVDSSLLSATLPATTLTVAWLAPGFRFHPTDEELVSYYLISTSISFGTFQGMTFLSQCLKDLIYPNIPSLQQSTTVGTNTKTVQNVDASADIGWGNKVGTSIVKTVHIIEKETCSKRVRP
ncbi:hypothetical protein HID58_095403 [Brassica napus]|uniref:Uncharacterized protein n=1 Tax=Brassica napus TaxID=3708 RepID=A0ABQ7X3Q6_BRANA|nr:hypothetical protein HID58_095403 [Brassica napus]